MPKFTKNAIKETFLKLLEERPLSQITIKDIVEECGINRNSFYYHYADMPALIEEVMKEEVDTLIREYPSIDSLEDGIDAALAFVLKNKKACLHIYNSVNREIFERYLMKECEYVVSTYINSVTPGLKVEDKDREIIIAYHKYVMFGAIIDWLSTGMRSDLVDDLHRLYELRMEISSEMLRKHEDYK